MTKEVKKTNSTIQSLEIGFNIVDIVAQSPTPLKFVDIQERSQMTKSNLYKYLNTLTQLGILSRDTVSGTFHLGMKLMEYSTRLQSNQDIGTMIAPHLREMSMETNNSVLHITPTFNGPMIARIFSPNQTLNIGGHVGTILPPNSSSGKVMTTYFDGPVINRWLQEANDTIDPFEMQQIQLNKIAFSLEPLIESISSLSFPILNFNNELQCIITVVGFTSNLTFDLNSELAHYCRVKQREISTLFGA